MQERAEEAARLAVAAVGLARRIPLQQPLSRRLGAELQQIAGVLGRAGRFEQARRLVEAAALAQDNGGRPRAPPSAEVTSMALQWFNILQLHFSRGATVPATVS